MELRFWAATDTGRVRDHNEDNFLVDQDLQLFVVCDGMGGHAAGEVASAVCVRTVRDVVAAQTDLLARIRESPHDKVATERLKQLLRQAVTTACARIYEMAQNDPSRRGMGTTCVAVVLVGGRGFVGHVGDSRMYRIRQGRVAQVTDDHSLLNEMIRQGQVPPGTTEEEFPHKNAVTRAVGVHETVDVDAFIVDIDDGDRLLMCSDGLSEYFDDSVDLLEMMDTGDPEATTDRCIDYANESGGKDNITVVVIDCVQEEPQVQSDAGPRRDEVIEMLRTTAYFHYLGPEELEKIRQMATRIDVDADEAVVADDEDNDRLHLILKGSVSLQLDGEQVSVLTTGEHFGEMALIDAQDEKDTNLVARTLEPSIFLTIERDQFVGLLRTAPGLAVKLLWNFVQVFADRLQSVPPEYRFTPDEWRDDPEAIADVTPPSGTLVFEEDLQRMQDGEAPDEAVDDEVNRPATSPPAAQARADDTGRDDEGMRETMSLEAVNREGMDTLPPGVETSGDVTSGADDDGDSPSVEFNPPTARRKPSGDPTEDAGLSSGTYDQSVLEAGAKRDDSTQAGGPSDDAGGSSPSVTINHPEDGDQGHDRRGHATAGSNRAEADETSPVRNAGADALDSKDNKSVEPSKDERQAGRSSGMKSTMKLDWNKQAPDGSGAPPAFDGEGADHGNGGRASTGGDDPATGRPATGTDERKSSSQSPEPEDVPPLPPTAGNEESASGESSSSPVPSADILERASRPSPAVGTQSQDAKQNGTTGPQASGDAEGDEEPEGPQPVSGQSEVVSDDDAPEPEEPKVMIASDLVADAEEND